MSKVQTYHEDTDANVNIYASGNYERVQKGTQILSMNGLSIYDNKTLGDRHCWYCGEWLFEGIRTKDHFYPKRLGGKLKVRCCKNCNGIKSHMTPLRFIEYLQELKADHPAKEFGYDRRINATQSLWDRVKWSLNDDKKTIYEQTT